MKNIIHIINITLFSIPMLAFAQDRMQDVIYKKDGSIYKGTIIEQVPNVSYKIQSKDGNVYAIQIAEVEKITKETLPSPNRFGRSHWGHWNSDTVPFQMKQRGYFFEGQLLIENVQGGARFVNGYKFGRFGYLGVGVGIDHVFSNPFNPKVNGLKKKELSATYSLLYLYHAGDGPTRGRFTPFYAIEAGWAMAMKGFGDKDQRYDDYGNRVKGGAMAGAGLGFKMQSRRGKGHFSLLFNVNYKRVNYENNVMIFNNIGQLIGKTSTDEIGHLIIPGIRFGIGF